MQISSFAHLADNQAAHIVLDLETLSTQPNALVLSIGATALNRHGELLEGSGLHLVLDQHAQEKRRHVDLGTVRWWEEKTSDEAKAASYMAPAGLQSFVENALSTFTEYVNMWASPDVCVWGNGCSFDNVILSSLYQDWGKQAPWQFWNDRDMRTITAIYPHLNMLPFTGIKHHALHDAQHEAAQLSLAIKLIQSQHACITAVAA